MKHTAIVKFDHLGIRVRGARAARKFYQAALGALGMKLNADYGDSFAFGSKREKIFWITRDPKAAGGAHVAFRVDLHAEVDAFHAAGVAAGGSDFGPPGPRPDYGPNYYAAFVKDPEGNNLEAVCYAPMKRAKKKKGK